LPSAIRFPRGEGAGVERPERGQILPIGKGRIVEEGTKVALVNLGARLTECRKAASILNSRGISTTVADMRFAKPIDLEMLSQLAAEHEALITVEEGSAGGFGSHVLHHLANAGTLDRGLKLRSLTLPDIFQEQDAPYKQYEKAGLNASGIVAKALEALGADEKQIVAAAIA
ncbi:MAG: transketolase C-terminal domain-containing protein, partial [Alphaproteobacteria bacterium]|nr:transketolase C-terminal domain-containing protein [Alphaproteobacteria bacterium]